MNLRPAIFFDRDGVVNVSPPRELRYLRRWEELHFIEGMIEVLAEVKAKGYPMILITNQQGVGKGLMSLDALQEVHRAMQAALGDNGASFDGIYAATGLTGKDVRRKPSPRMLEEAAREHGIDLSRSWMIGDHDNDMRAGAAAGTGTIRVQGLKEISVASDFRVADVPALRRLLLELL